MRIYIPSFKRWKTIGVEGTVARIPYSEHQRCVVVVRHCEQDDYHRSLMPYINDGLKLLVVPDDIQIAEKRRRIGLHAAAHGEEKFAMMDDDLVFAVRKSETGTSLRRQDDSDFLEMLVSVEDHLERYAHVAISLRQGNNNSGPGPSPLLAECGRGIRCVGYKTETFNSCEHGRVRIMEDIDITLQLLRRGMPNAILFWWAQDQKQTNAPGGCSEWRTKEVQETEALKLHALHPEFTKPREKANKTGGDFGTRTELTVFWRKAFQSSQA